MGKNPSFPFYPSDWTRDLDDQDIEIEGAWIRICCRLWWMPERGKATKSVEEWARILRKSEQKTIEIFQKLIGKDIASGELLLNQKDNQKITIISRRMVNDYRIHQIRKEVGKLGGNPMFKKGKENPYYNLDNQKDKQKITSSSSSSSSSSKNKNTPLPPKGYTDDFETFWKAYPKKIGKGAALNAWKKNGRPGLEIILRAVEDQKQSVQWKKDNGQFIPLPTTWLNQARWGDELPKNTETERWLTDDSN